MSRATAQERARVFAAASREEEWAQKQCKVWQKRGQATKAAKKQKRIKAAQTRKEARRAAFEKENDEKFKQTWYYDN